MEVIPLLSWKDGLEVPFGLLHILGLGQSPSGCETMNVGVDGEGWDVEGLCHDDAGRLVTHAWEGFEGVE